MPHPLLAFHQVSFAYPDSPRDVIQNLNIQPGPGWTGIVGANGSGKSTLVQLAVGQLQPTHGNVSRPELAVYCPQRTDRAPTLLVNFLEAHDSYRWIESLAVGYDWPERWQQLSHGERKRAQLAVALWQQPDLLVVDEPTNHLDSDARTMLADSLAGFHGIGLLVSHDRDFMDALCSQTLYMGDEPVLKSGNYSESSLELARENLANQRAYERSRAERKRVERQARKAREDAQRSDTRLSKRKIHRKDHDARSKIDAARLSGKDAVAGRLQNRIDARLTRVIEQERRYQPEKQANLGIQFGSSNVGARASLYLPPTCLPLGEERHLTFPALNVGYGERIGITGPNGAGKSTLIRYLIHQHHFEQNDYIYLPQECSTNECATLLAEIKSLPGEEKGRLMQLVSHLGSDPKAILNSELPSPGETRKLLLALGLIREPRLVVMDEPTNHLDLPSIRCLEQALAEVPCTVLLISHDRAFLTATTDTEWRLEVEGGNTHLSTGNTH